MRKLLRKIEVELDTSVHPSNRKYLITGLNDGRQYYILKSVNFLGVVSIYTNLPITDKQAKWLFRKIQNKRLNKENNVDKKRLAELVKN